MWMIIVGYVHLASKCLKQSNTKTKCWAGRFVVLSATRVQLSSMVSRLVARRFNQHQVLPRCLLPCTIAPHSAPGKVDVLLWQQLVGMCEELWEWLLHSEASRLLT